MGREVRSECPRCRLVATRPPGRQTRCTHCGAELVTAHGPSEEWIRAYLYGSDGEGLRIRPLDRREEVVR
jgi:hypothetical protein